MLKIKEVFKVFSKRNKIEKPIEISVEVRNRVIMLLIDLSNNDREYGWGRNNFNVEVFFDEILRVFMMRLGKFDLIDRNDGIVNGVGTFLLNCEGEMFLDFIEDSFKSNELRKVWIDKKNEFIENINYIFSIEGIKFELTKYKEYWREEGRGKVLESTTYPKIICKEDIFINSELIEPAIELLMDDRFKNANNEFLEGLEHYKHKRYKESIASCCCALESVMKIISSINKWQYSDNATGLPLIKNIIEKSQSPNWYEGIISPTLTLRNKLGPHGKGTNEIIPTKAQAQLQINLVASQVIFLIEEYII
ncbi:DUF7014 domain-containing protein [Clostridium sp.]|uniref:DUF7014 domain-containing protein n=1 Tax=Clostridium sp. TaxID=1506 RepID=UPI002904C096|nr:hypothetical protein [Clostridium sp.]MDU1968993.1 hypothetical protein [Clostridium perfringens]MDU1823969.1 hypothetical protein [Clostridium sp.]MDU1841024.1 hypothetical protein [Clostridium sp.]MDU2691403.1 hypothetical protein [Clostridium sp.]MDU2957262.1 hypothetical protein [Clostridium sp.]